MNLFELSQQALELQQLLLEGEIDEDIFTDTMENIGIEEKLENYCKVIRNIEADVVAYKKIKDEFAEKQKVSENAVKRLKQAVLTHMQNINSKKEKAGLFSITKSSTKSVNIENEELIPLDYLIAQPPKVDKTAIAEVLKSGQAVAGASLQENEYVRIK